MRQSLALEEKFIYGFANQYRMWSIPDPGMEQC